VVVVAVPVANTVANAHQTIIGMGSMTEEVITCRSYWGIGLTDPAHVIPPLCRRTRAL
jgi:hypothetical protein